VSSQLTLECRDLLDRIFVVDDARRITIDQIRYGFHAVQSGFTWARARVVSLVKRHNEHVRVHHFAKTGILH